MADKYWWETEDSNNQSQGYWWDDGSVSSTVSKKITDSVNAWMQSHNNYVTNYQKRTKGRNYNYEDSYVQDSYNWMATVSKQKQDFDKSAESILAYMDQYKGFLDADFVKSVQDTLTGARGQQDIVVGNAKADSKWWSNFANEDEYKTAQRYDGYTKKYTGQKYDDIQKALSLLDDGEEKNWLIGTQHELYKTDRNYTSKALSGLKSFEAQKEVERKQEEDKTWWERIAENYANSSPDTSLPAANLSIVTAGYRNDTSWREPSDKWSEGQKRQFGYLYAEDPNKAYAYAEQLNNYYNSAEKYAQQQGIQATASKDGWSMAGHTLGAIATAPLGLADYLDDLAEYSARGTITQKNMITPFEYGQAAQSGIANKLNEMSGTIDDDVWVLGGKGLGDVYSLGVSAANSLLSAYTLGGTGTLINFIGQGGASGVDDALSRGATPEQALLYGTIVGAAEGVTEMINADNLLKVGSSATLKNYLLKALNQGIGESVEEGASSLIGNIADNIIMQDKSNFHATVKEIMEANPGMKEEEAKKQAWIKMVGDTVFDAMGGFATGVGNAMTVGAASTAWDARNGNQKNIDAVNQYGEHTADLIQEGLQNDQKSESYKLAQKYQKQTQGTEKKSGKAMTGFQIRNLLAANQAEVTKADLQNIQSTAEKRLIALGQKEDVSKIAELATKYATGGDLTRSEKSFLTRTQNGSQVTSELLNSLQGVGSDSLLSKWENNMSEGWGDNYSTEWAEGIETKAVRNVAQAKKMVRAFLDAAANMPVEDPAAYKSLTERTGTDSRFGVSESGQATIRATGKAFDFENAEVAEVGDGQMSFKREDGGKVSAGGIDFVDDNQSFLVSAVSDIENITPAAATEVMHKIVDMSKPLGEQLNGIDEAFTYGRNGYSVEDLKAGNFAKNLSEEQMMRAYELGQEARKENKTANTESIKKMRTAAQAVAEKAAAEGKEAPKAKKLSITYNHGGGVVEDIETARKKLGKLSKEQRAGMEAANILHQMGIGTDFELFTSYYSKTLKDKDGKPLEVFLNDEGQEEAAYAGVYMDANGKIRINLNAYSGTRGLTLNALSHELTHFIKAWSLEKYEAMADFLVKSYGEHGVSMHKLVLKEQSRLEGIRGKEVSYSEAYDEVVANAFNRMLEDGKVMERIAEIRQVDKSLADKIIAGIRKFIKRFMKVYKDNQSLFLETEALMEMKEVFEELQEMFAEALVDASDSFQASLIAQETEAVKSLGENAKVEMNAAGELLLAANESGNVLMYSENTYLNGGREKLEMALRQNGHTVAEIQETLSYVDDALDYIKILAAGYAKNMGYTNLSDHLVADIVTNVKTGKQVMSAIVNNGDYPVNIDLSLICKKRVAYMNLMSRLIRDGVFDKVNYDGAAIAEVNEILRENGFETACLGCFVESRRLQFQTWAETIVSEWNAEVEKRNPNAQSFGFAKGKMEALTDADINALTRELESVKKNDQGNVNLGQGNSVTRMGRLLDALPSLQKKLTVEDLLTPEGLTALRKHDGSLFSIVKSRYGAASPKIVQDFNPYASEIAMLTFAQVKGITNNAVKGAQAYVTDVKNEYGKLKKAKGESKADFDQRKKEHEQRIQDEAMRRYLYDIGGARIQSFSDFMIENIFDYIQIFADLAAKRLPLHGYTKEIVAMRLFGMTGAKWNGSLIAHVERNMGKEHAGLLPAGTKDGIPVKVNGKDYVIGFDDYARNAATGGKSFIQSIGMKDIIALQLDPRYAPYVGSITIGVSDAQILAMLDSPLFRMVIPYHASGMLPQFAKLVGVDMYNDYTDYQNTTVRQYYDLNGNAVSELKNAKGETVKADTSYAFNAEIQKTKDAKTAANNYLKWCAQRHEVHDGSKLIGYATFNPKFSSSPYGTDFTRHENYYKLLEDFNTYDCITEASTVQGAVTMNFPSEQNRLTAQQMEAYKQALRDTGIFTEKDIEKFAKKADMTFKEIIAAEVGNRANYAATQAPKWESTVKAVEAKLQKDYAREQYSSQGTDFTKEFDYSELNWARDLGIINAKDIAIFERAIRNEILRGAKPQSANGEYIIDTGRCLMFTDGDFHNPTLSRVIEFVTEYESLTADAKEMIYDEAKATGEVHQSIQTIEKMFGSGFVSIRNQPTGRSYGWQAGGRKGSNRNRIAQNSRSLKERFAEEGLSHLLEDDEVFSSQETDADYIRYDRRAILKESKVDEYLYDYAAKSSPKYAQAYIAYVRPRTFLKLTTDDVWERYHIADQAGELDEERLSNSRPGIYLRIDHETGEVTGHEGRHRMSAMDSAGIELVPVLLVDTSNKMTKTDIAEIMLHGQFDETAIGIVKDLIPLNYENRDRVIKNFATQSSTQRIGERYGMNKTLHFSTQQTDNITNRHLLANAFEGISQNSDEYKMIQQYKGYIAELNSLEAKLSEFNRDIRKIRFGTEGARDAEKLARLEEEARKIAEAINRYDKKLLSLEASEPLRKVIERERKKEARKTMDHVKEIQQNKKVRAEQAELRHKIRKAIRDLDKILNHGNKQKNVKEDLQSVVTKALKAADILFTENYGNYDMLRNGIGADLSDAEEELVNTCARMLRDIDKMPTDGYDSWQARQEAEKRLSTKMAKLKDVFARERKRLNNTKVSSILGELADAYASLENSEQSYVQGAYIEAVHNFLKSLQAEVGGTIVNDMTKDQLEAVYAAYKMVLTTVRKANELFNKGIKMSREQLGNAVIQEVTKAGGTHGLWTKAEIARSQADWNNTKPVWVANRIGSDSFGKLMQGLFEGQYNFAVDIEEAKQFKLGMDQKYHPRSWDAEKLYPFESSTGKKFSLNLQQIMSIYAFSKREQAYSHLLNGGFVFEGNSTVIVDEKGRKKTYIHNGAASYKLNEATLNDIISSLTKEQKAYVDEMQAYLSDVMGAKGNEVSMKLYGIQMFKEKFYFPLRSSGAYMERAKEAEMKKQQGQINLVNSGFTHAVKPQAKNPIILSGFMDVWAEHCNEMSMYHSMVLPMEDFRKVYNYSTVHDDKFDSASVYQTIQDAYGKAATDYIDQLYRELNAGATVDPRETPFKARISKFKKAAVMLSASVVVQQFSSIGRAYALIDPKYFVGAKVNSSTSLAVVDEMKKYAPVAIIKEMGGFDTGTKGSAKNYIMAEHYGKGERIQGLKKDEQYRSDLMGYFPAKADEKTWCAIWEAVKRETKAKHPKMDVKSEEFLKLAGDRFSEVIEKTQVYDSVLARSANMRSKGAFMAMATAFMAEPTTTVNLLEDAIRSRSVKQMARAFGAVAVSIVLNNALSSIVYAMRDDDEDETFIEKYFQSFTSGMIDDINPMSYYPFLKDVYSLFQGYDVERADMSVIADLRDAMKKAVTLIGKYDPDMDEDELAAYWKDVNIVMMSLLDAGCSAFGVPLKNVRRDANGIINAYNTIHTDLTERDTTWTSFWDKVGAAAKDTIPIYAWTKDRSKQDKLYEAILKGDTQYVARLKSGYKTDEAYHSAVRTALRENDTRVKAAAQAHINGDPSERVRIAKQIIADGFDLNDVILAINAEIDKLTPDKESSSTAKVKGYYKVEDFVREAANGDTASLGAIREDILKTAQANGKTADEAEKDFVSDIKSEAKDAYFAGTIGDAKAAEILARYAELNDEEADDKVNYWAFVKAHPEYKDVLNESNVKKYLDLAEPAEIPLDIYIQYVNGTKGLETIHDENGEEIQSKREQVLEVIDALPLTWKQKDALYLAHEYAESKIWDVPW